MSKRKTLPAAVVPDDAYDLLVDFAHEQRVTVSEAVRRLIQESPALVSFALKQGKALDFGVEPWRKQGGD